MVYARFFRISLIFCCIINFYYICSMKTILTIFAALLLFSCNKSEKLTPGKSILHKLEVTYKPQFNHSYFTFEVNYPNGNVDAVYQTNTNNTVTRTVFVSNVDVLISGNSYYTIQGVDTMIIKLDNVTIEHFIGSGYSNVFRVN